MMEPVVGGKSIASTMPLTRPWSTPMTSVRRKAQERCYVPASLIGGKHVDGVVRGSQFVPVLLALEPWILEGWVMHVEV